jgi:hypothetical protein
MSARGSQSLSDRCRERAGHLGRSWAFRAVGLTPQHDTPVDPDTVPDADSYDLTAGHDIYEWMLDHVRSE